MTPQNRAVTGGCDLNHAVNISRRVQLDAELAAILADALVADLLDDLRRDGQFPSGNQP